MLASFQHITLFVFVSNIEQGLLQETTSCDFILQS